MPQQIFKTHSRAAAKVRSLEKKGIYDASIGVQEYQLYPGTRNTRTRKTYTVYWSAARRNSAKRPKKGKVSKRIGAALSGWLKKQNPAFKKASSVYVERLKGGAIKFTPEK